MAPHQPGLDVRIGIAFTVPVARFPRNEPGQPFDDVAGDGRIGAFVDRHSRRGVRHEDA